MTTTQQFSGLTMPVFTAFGWAGQEAAVNFALEQLEAFIQSLHHTLPREIQAEFPYYGLNRREQYVYLAVNEDIDSDAHILFFARPMSLELQLAFTDKKVLGKGLYMAEKQPTMVHRLITELGVNWSLRIQQMQVDEDTGEASHYADLYKDEVVNLDEETAVAILSKAGYLNGEDKWITPLYLSHRFNSEKISVMGMVVLDVVGKEIQRLMPFVQFFTGRKASKAKSKPRAKAKAVKKEVLEEQIPEMDAEEGFVFVTEIKPLYLRKGFINLTPEHWDFFALNSRTETRKVTVYYEGVYDKDSAVWHIQSNGMTRLVLSPSLHHWLEDNFAEGDHIHLLVKQLDGEEIQVSLKSID